MVPDVVLAGRDLGGPERRVIVLDAKYRINDGLNDALNSIHTYRDALVQEVASGRTEGIVTAAYLLTPHVPAGLHADFKATPVPGRRPLTPLQLPVRPASVSLDSRRSRHLSKDDIARLMAELNAPLPPMVPLPQEIIRASPLFFSSLSNATCS
jgi:hypothetical protein